MNKHFVLIIIFIKIILLSLYTNDKIETTNYFNDYKEKFLNSEFFKNNYIKKENINFSKTNVYSKQELLNSIFNKNNIYLYDDKFIVINYENTNSKYKINFQGENYNIINLTFYTKDYLEKKDIFIYKYENIYDSNNNLLIKYIKNIEIQFIPISIYTETIELKDFIENKHILNNSIYINIISILLFIVIYVLINNYINEIKKQIIYIILAYIYIFYFIDIIYFISNLNFLFNNLMIFILLLLNYICFLYLIKNKVYRILILFFIFYLTYLSINYKEIFFINKKNDFFINKLFEDTSYKEIFYIKNCINISSKKICLFENEKEIEEQQVDKEKEYIYIKKEDLIEQRYLFRIEQNVYENNKTKEKIYVLKTLKTNFVYNINYKNKKYNEQFQLFKN